MTWNRRKTRIKPYVAGDSFYGHGGRAASKEIRKLMHIQRGGGGAAGINSRSKNWYNLARRVPCDPGLPPRPPAPPPDWPWIVNVGDPRQRGLTWAFLRESLYLRERARNINPRGSEESLAFKSRPPVPQERYDLTRCHGAVPAAMATCQLVWTRVAIGGAHLRASFLPEGRHRPQGLVHGRLIIVLGPNTLIVCGAIRSLCRSCFCF